MDVRKEIVKSLVEKGMGSEEEIEEVVRFTFYNVNKATSLHDNIEISGLGNLVFNHRKSKHMLSSMEKTLISIHGKRLKETEKTIEYIKKKNEQAEGISKADSQGNS